MSPPRTPLSPPQKLKIAEVEIVVINDRCKGCGFCIELCPKHVLDYESRLNIRGAHPPYLKNEGCVGCGVCEEICPEMAIFMKLKGKQK